MIKSIKGLFGKMRLKQKRQKFKSVSYSQEGEDMILRSFYEEQPDYKGFYIDVGALDPFRYSNTCYFYQNGWRGINIEPTPTAIDIFNKYRSEDINLNIGIGEQEGELVFYCFNEPALNSFAKELSEERSKIKDYTIEREVRVNIKRLDSVLSEHMAPGSKIDFMSIDAEGFDLQVLRSNDWVKFRPTYLLVEDLASEIGSLGSSEIYNYLHGLNYYLIAKTSRTLIMKDMDINS